MKKLFDRFNKIFLVDFEFNVAPGNHPFPICMVWKEIVSGETRKVWQDEFLVGQSPFGSGTDYLFVSYYSLAEFSCFQKLKWQIPRNSLDLYVEFRNITNGLPGVESSLLGALNFFNLQSIEGNEKDDMRNLAIRGGPFTKEERDALLEYCLSDVTALEMLLPKMINSIDLDRAVFRGNYMASLSSVELLGIPIDMEIYERLKASWQHIQLRLIKEVDHDYGVFEGTTFKAQRFEMYLDKKGFDWPRLPTGRLSLESESFKEMSLIYPEIQPLHQVRETLSKLKLNELTVGTDGRNRTMLSPFRSKTGRNQPSNSKNIFGMPSWIRSLIKPPKGKSLAYIDWSQQEFGIAAALSNDKLMKEAYTSSDPYLTFAKQANHVPPDATKSSHPREREMFKTCSLGVLFGMGPDALALKVNEPRYVALELLRLHRETYRDFWIWSDKIVEQAMLRNRLITVFGWGTNVTHEAKAQSLRNFPMQANGADMLRVALILMVDLGISVCMTVHDAILIEAPTSEINVMVRLAQDCMREASKIVLDGFELKSEAQIFNHPDRFSEPKGADMWSKVVGILNEVEQPCNT